MATKRITRQEVHTPDSLESSYERAQSFVQSHWKSVLVGVLILITAIAAGMIVTRSRAEAEGRAHVYWLRAQQDVAAGEYASALEYANTLLDQHGGTTSGKRAHIIKADALAGLGRRDQALEAYREAAVALSDDPILYTAARRGEATTLENLGQHLEAATIFETLADDAIPDGARIFDLKSAARNRARAGDAAAAIAAYEKLIERYGNSSDRVHTQEVHLAKVAIAEIRHAGDAGRALSAPAS